MRRDKERKSVRLLRKTEKLLFWNGSLRQRRLLIRLRWSLRIERLERRAIEESKLKMELEKLEMDDKEKARQHEINLKRLDQNLPVVTDSIPNDSFRLSGAIKFVPPFDDV